MADCLPSLSCLSSLLPSLLIQTQGLVVLKKLANATATKLAILQHTTHGPGDLDSLYDNAASFYLVTFMK